MSAIPRVIKSGELRLRGDLCQTCLGREFFVMSQQSFAAYDALLILFNLAQYLELLGRVREIEFG